MKQFIINATILHIVFLLSIFYIHFRSPIIKNLPIGSEHEQPPADRLVLFVGDGLRAESFLQHSFNRTPYLKHVLLTSGTFAISNTRVPTESRPGHAALLGGVYEDPSAVFRGWKENPVEFDSVLNRSAKSFCWGSPDIINMFSRGAIPDRVTTSSYASGDEIFSQSANTSLLDVWVFDRVREFFVTEQMFHRRKKMILFLHLLGLDTAGHVHKPYSELFTENLSIVDRGIEAMVKLLEQATKYDGRTAYVFTADHGMTDKGAHGAGEPFETETPFLAWGAGFKRRQEVESVNGSSKITVDGNHNIPALQINQADVAPLISSVLGLAVPKNSLGKLPKEFLNASEDYIAWSMQNNAEQLLAQYYHLQRDSEDKLLQIFSDNKQVHFKQIIDNLKHEITKAKERKQFHHMITLSDLLIDVALEAIEYYQTYHKPELFFSITVTMLGWIVIMVRKTFEVKPFTESFSKRVVITAIMIGCFVILLNIAQKTPMATIFYFLVPVAIWGFIGSSWRQYFNLLSTKAVMYCLGFALAVETLVIAFMDQRLISILLLCHCFLVTKQLYSSKRGPSNIVVARWILSNIMLAIFPILPPLARDNSSVQILVFATIAWMLYNIFAVSRSTFKYRLKYMFTILQLLQSANFLLFIYFIQNGYTVTTLQRVFCWIFAFLGIIIPLLSSVALDERLLALFGGLSLPYTMLSLSYEPLFLMAFVLTLYNWLEVEDYVANGSTTVDKLCFSNVHIRQGMIDYNHARRTFAFILFLLTSFFGTGNLATVSSFDPNSVRCFVSTFSPFTMMALIVLKLLIPVLIVSCVLKALIVITSVEKSKVFTLVLIICDLMSLNFFFMITNRGSWMEIGTSISHFVIIECTTIIVILLYSVANFLTTFRCGTAVDGMAAEHYLPYSSKVSKD